MTFIVSTQTLSAGWEQAQEAARQLRSAAQALKAASLAGPVASSTVLYFERDLRAFRDRFDVIGALPGIAAYVSGLPNTPQGYDVATEFNAMRTQIQATIDWIRANYPRDSTSTYLMERQWAADGLTERTFTTAALASFRTQLDALLATL